jgi:hypothetical protein
MAKAKKKLSKAEEAFFEVNGTFHVFLHALANCCTADGTPEAFADYIAPDDAECAIYFLQRIHGGDE